MQFVSQITQPIPSHRKTLYSIFPKFIFSILFQREKLCPYKEKKSTKKILLNTEVKRLRSLSGLQQL